MLANPEKDHRDAAWRVINETSCLGYTGCPVGTFKAVAQASQDGLCPVSLRVKHLSMFDAPLNPDNAVLRRDSALQLRLECLGFPGDALHQTGVSNPMQFVRMTAKDHLSRSVDTTRRS